MEDPKKGDWTGECNRTVCKNKPATWVHKDTKKYYCGSCARKINKEHNGPPLVTNSNAEEAQRAVHR